jgi:hypothetical protein
MPNKAKSKKQARFFGAVAGGAIKKKGLSSSKAKEMVKGTKMSKLPEKKHSSKRKPTKSMVVNSLAKTMGHA